ncbi:MAG TPA: chalcone isomerase family protein [Stellaceae bacterium]|nr:chalcone isomerase family protein [Stellaceae bacterium]
MPYLRAFVLGFAILWTGAASAASCRDVDFPDKVDAPAPLVLNGLGLRKATFLAVRVYVAGLYLPQKSGDAREILGTDRPWYLLLHFVRDVGASDIRDAFAEGFKKSAGDRLAALATPIAALQARMIDFKEGQTLAFASTPGKGVTMTVNGASGAPIDGPGFANALLGIWLGPEPPNADLKTGLLGGKCE